MSLLPAAIGIILHPDLQQVLLVKRRDVPVWVLPGGGIEPQERAEQALLREVQEETGYQVKILRQCAEYYPVNRLATLTSVFICHIHSGNLCLSTETSAVAFYPLDKLPPTFFPPHAHWLQEALTHDTLIQRNLNEISYFALGCYLLRHPWQVARFAWTRFIQSKQEEEV